MCSSCYIHVEVLQTKKISKASGRSIHLIRSVDTNDQTELAPEDARPVPWPESSWSVFGLLRSRFWILSVGGRSFLLACINFIPLVMFYNFLHHAVAFPQYYIRGSRSIWGWLQGLGLQAGTRGPQTPPEERHWPLLAYVAVRNVAEPCPPLVFWYCNLDFNISLKSVSDIYSRHLW